VRAVCDEQSKRDAARIRVLWEAARAPSPELPPSDDDSASDGEDADTLSVPSDAESVDKRAKRKRCSVM